MVKKVVFIVITLVALTACEKYSYEPVVIDSSIPVSFATEVQPVFTKTCIGCHGGGRKPDLRVENSYESLLSNEFITTDTTQTESSRLYEMITVGHKSLTSDIEKQTIINWMKQGAKNN